MAIAKVNVGESIKSHMRAETWNAFVDAANFVKLRPGNNPDAGYLASELPSLTCMVKNDSGVAIERGHVLGISAPIITPVQNASEFSTRIGVVGVEPAASQFGKFVVAAESIPEGEIGLGVLAGFVACEISVTHEFLTRCDVDPGYTTRLCACPHGTGQIVWKETGTGIKRAIVRLGALRDAHVIGKTTATVADGADDAEIEVWAAGAATGYSLTNVLFDWMTGGESISSGKEVMVSWFADELVWRITGAECE